MLRLLVGLMLPGWLFSFVGWCFMWLCFSLWLVYLPVRGVYPLLFGFGLGCCMMLHGDGFGFWLVVVGCFAGRWLDDVIGFVEFWCLWFGACGFTVYLFDLDWF